MDNAQKAIMIGVGLFITIIIISVVLLITNLGTGTINDATESVSNMNKSLQEQIKRLYDNRKLTGAEVKNLYQQYKDSKEVWLVIQYEDDGDGIVEYTECAVNSELYNILRYDQNNISTYATSVSGYIKDNVLGSNEKALGLIKDRYNDPNMTANMLSMVSSSAKYKTQLIYGMNWEVIGIFCKLI